MYNEQCVMGLPVRRCGKHTHALAHYTLFIVHYSFTIYALGI